MAEPLDAILERERAMILDGDLAGLAGLAPGKEAGLAEWRARAEAAGPPGHGAGHGAGYGAARAPAAEGRRLAALVARNQALLAAALEGVRDALRRRAEMAEARASLSTYDAAGARARTAAPPRVERRA